MIDKNNLSNIVHLVIDNYNNTFSILNILPSIESNISVNMDKFMKKFSDIFKILPRWL
jgi:hypothetical protein